MNMAIKGPDGKMRCHWYEAAPEFLSYHDKEWEFPVHNDFKLFEKLCLESFQSVLSWRTILVKHGNFRKAFLNFDFNKISCFTKQDVDLLLKNDGIVRHKGKIEAVINNAKCVKELVKKEGSLASFIWKFKPNQKQTRKPQPASTSTESMALSKAPKKRGWKFVGPTTVYAFMQAMGLFNDHIEECVVRKEVEKKRKSFKRPK